MPSLRWIGWRRSLCRNKNGGGTGRLVVRIFSCKFHIKWVFLQIVKFLIAFLQSCFNKSNFYAFA